ncbi:DUF4259 domain-containing protein [Embleya sp. NPDC005971]|uniref:DUF4259 domain-containing protein n=1 Tax=Embleya sp. NPDC005971 TaxID=3156724 RepID=UPI0033DC18CA
MGTWDIGPFENDMAADFASTLDEAAEADREKVVRDTLVTTIDTRDHLDGNEGCEAVAAAALIAAQCSDGEPVSPFFGPKEPVPAFARELRSFAVDALDRVLAPESELAELWDDTPDGPRWRLSIDQLRWILDPRLRPQEDVLFEI